MGQPQFPDPFSQLPGWAHSAQLGGTAGQDKQTSLLQLLCLLYQPLSTTGKQTTPESTAVLFFFLNLHEKHCNTMKE